MDPELAQLLLTYLLNQSGSETSGGAELEKYNKYALLISNGMGALNSMGDYWAALARREDMIEDIQRQNELEASYADRALGPGQGGGGSQHVEEPSLVQALLGAGRYAALGAIGLINKPNSTTPEHGTAEIEENEDHSNFQYVYNKDNLPEENAKLNELRDQLGYLNFSYNPSSGGIYPLMEQGVLCLPKKVKLNVVPNPITQSMSERT